MSKIYIVKCILLAVKRTVMCKLYHVNYQGGSDGESPSVSTMRIQLSIK